jgi:hypothetical protein
MRCECGAAAVGVQVGQAGHSTWCPARVEVRQDRWPKVKGTTAPPCPNCGWSNACVCSSGIDTALMPKHQVEQTIQERLDVAAQLPWRVRYTYQTPDGQQVTVQE